MNSYFEVLCADSDKVIIKKDKVILDNGRGSVWSVLYISNFDKITNTFLKFKIISDVNPRNFDIVKVIAGLDITSSYNPRGSYGSNDSEIDINWDYNLQMSHMNDYFFTTKKYNSWPSEKDRIVVYNCVNKYVMKLGLYYNLSNDIILYLNSFLVINGEKPGQKLFSIDICAPDKYIFNNDNNIVQLSTEGYTCHVYNIEEIYIKESIKKEFNI